MRGVIEWTPRLVRTVENGQWNAELRGPRVGVMLHYDGSLSDSAAVDWFADPRCRVSYQILVLDDGTYVRIAPDTARAWHAGVCRSSSDAPNYYDANSAFYGISAATTDGVDVTAPQTLTIAFLVRRWFDLHGWDASETHRIVDHRTEAWPRGRKSDPQGSDPFNPILATDDIRSLVGHVRISDNVLTC